MARTPNRESEFNPVGCLTGGVILLVIGACVIITTIKCGGGLNIEYGEGSRSGVVQKISRKGLFWKTYEGELNLGYNTNSGGKFSQVVPAIFKFSTSNAEVAKVLEDAERSGDRVMLKYKEYLFRGYDKGQTGYDIIEVVRETE